MPTHETKASTKILIKKWTIFAAAVAVFSAAAVFGSVPQTASAAGPTGSTVAPGSVAAGGVCTASVDCNSGLECNAGLGICTPPGDGSAGAACQGSLDAQCSQSPTPLTCSQGYCIDLGASSVSTACAMNTNTADGCDDADGYTCKAGTCYNSSGTPQAAGMGTGGTGTPSSGATPPSSAAPTIGTLGIQITGIGQVPGTALSPQYSMVATMGGTPCTAANCGSYSFAWSDNGKPITGCSQNWTCTDTIPNSSLPNYSDAVSYVAKSNGNSYNSASIILTTGSNTGDMSGLSGGTASFGIDITSMPGISYNLSATISGQICSAVSNPAGLCGMYSYAWTKNGSPIVPPCSSWTCSDTIAVGSTGADAIAYTATNTSTGAQYGSGTLNITANSAVGNQSGASGAQAPVTANQIASAAPAAPSGIVPCVESGWTCPIVSIITSVTNVVTTFLQWILTSIVFPMMQILLTLQPHTLQFAAVILQGWVVVRNVLNIVFVLALLFVGLMTLFGLGNFDPQQWLIKIVTNAILINFSLVIAQAILGVADTLQAQFLPSDPNALKAIGVALIGAQGKAPFASVINLTGTYSQAVAAILGVVVAFFIVLVMVTITAMLAYRIVMLWILLLLSPAAYALNAMPFGGTAKYAQRWWHEFLCWSFFTPFMALGITLTVTISQTVQQFLQSGTNLAFPGSPSAATSAAATLTYNILIICVVLGLLYGFEKAAKGGSCGGAGVIVDKVSSFGHNTLRGKGAFTAMNTARTTVAGAAAGLGTKLADNPNAGRIAFVAGSTLKAGASALTYDKVVREEVANTPGMRLLTKEGREKAHAENEAALKDIHELRMTGVNPSENYKNIMKKRDEEAAGRYANKPVADLSKALDSAEDFEKAVILKATAADGKIEALIKERKIGDGTYSAANVKALVASVGLSKDATKDVLDGMSKGMKKKNLMMGIELDPKLVDSKGNTDPEKVKAELLKHFDSLSFEDKLKINVKGLSPYGVEVLKPEFKGVYDSASIDEQRKVSAKQKEWSGIKEEEDARKKKEDAAKTTKDEAREAKEDAARAAAQATAEKHAQAMKDLADKLKP